MIFEVTPEHIERLSDSDLRTLIGFLAEQEAIRAGQSASGITYGGNQNAPERTRFYLRWQGVERKAMKGFLPYKTAN